HIVYTEQNISYQWSDKSLYDFLFEGHLDRIEHLALQARIQLQALGLDYNDIIHRFIHTFSGGEKVKLSLAKALMQDPDVLLMDEPSNDLDFETIQFLEDFLINRDMPLMFISHDQRLLENVANGIVHIQHIHNQRKTKTFVYRGDYLSYKKAYFRKFESDMQVANKQRSNHQIKLKKFRQIYTKVNYQQNQAVRNPGLGRLLKKKIHALKSQEKRFEREKEAWVERPEKEEAMHIFFDSNERFNANKRMFELCVDDFVLPDGKRIKHVEICLSGQDKAIIYGKNGVGKTTLLKALIERLKQEGIQFGYLPQNYMDVLVANQSVVDFLMTKQKKYPEYRIRQILGQLGFKRKEMDERCVNLSEGQKLKVLLLYLVSLETELLLLDEPTRNVSPMNQDEMYQLFFDYPGAILAITHDRAFIEAVFDSIYELTEAGLNIK
ncbi:MAG TPA: ATP-binding cassette domain-containing protein, partial [Candidatus Izemoplasmatales bacterium]|nr:ATP-binding cassette domain-containing protein [Candidatus Izemoplasmatales bacterium]